METTQEFLELYDNNHTFTESDICTILWGGFEDDKNLKDVEKTQSDEGRWSAYMNTIVAINTNGNKRYFSIDWNRGLTEYQDNSYDCQPVEVIPETKTITETITIWKEVK